MIDATVYLRLASGWLLFIRARPLSFSFWTNRLPSCFNILRDDRLLEHKNKFVVKNNVLLIALPLTILFVLILHQNGFSTNQMAQEFCPIRGARFLTNQMAQFFLTNQWCEIFMPIIERGGAKPKWLRISKLLRYKTILLTHWEDAGVRIDNERIPGKKRIF